MHNGRPSETRKRSLIGKNGIFGSREYELFVEKKSNSIRVVIYFYVSRSLQKSAMRIRLIVLPEKVIVAFMDWNTDAIK